VVCVDLCGQIGIEVVGLLYLLWLVVVGFPVRLSCETPAEVLSVLLSYSFIIHCRYYVRLMSSDLDALDSTWTKPKKFAKLIRTSA